MNSFIVGESFREKRVLMKLLLLLVWLASDYREQGVGQLRASERTGERKWPLGKQAEQATCVLD